MDRRPQQRYIRHYQDLRERAKSIRKDPEREAAELERTADLLESQLPFLFPPDEARALHPRPAPRPIASVTREDKPGFYAEDLRRFLAEHGPAQVSEDILPHLRSLHGDKVEADPIRKLLKRAHRNPQSLIMRSPSHERGAGVYTVARDLAEKRQAFPELYEPGQSANAVSEGSDESSGADA
jgi:hypothetical protein